jgi:C4-dicarboxylate-specific signal transduction histidine kinase
LVKIRLIKDKQGKPVRMIGSSIDITKLVCLEEQQKEQQKKYVNSSKLSALGEMAGGISHEINNPLAIIIGLVLQMRSLLSKNPLSREKLSEILSKVETHAHRIVKIVKGLRNISRDADNDPMEIFLVSQAIQDTMELCQERFKAQSIDLRVEVTIGPDTALFGRSIQISQVLINLLNNAFDAAMDRPEKWVELKVQSTDASLLFYVKDSGPGIAHSIAEKMMQPFFTSKQVGQGMGLGLSIAKSIIDAHGGHLHYDAQSPHTLFVIELPLHRGSQP